jgi:nucleoside-diphosphate-sugar epimerase
MSENIVFITGATGFIGSQILENVLKAGHYARISVRKDSQVGELKEIFASYADKLDFVVIPDIATPIAFDQALNNVKYVIHVASPMPSADGDVQKAYVEPAVNATEAILEAANITPSVERVIIMASAVALMPLGTLMRTDIIINGRFLISRSA